jgi:putative oxidoreductase
MSKLGRIAVWVCQILLAAMFVYAGAAKFGNPVWVRMFARWGYPDHFCLVIGAIEVAAGVGLLIPRTAAFSALTLLVVMAGAGITHLVHGEMQRLPQIVVIMALSSVVAYARRRPLGAPRTVRAPV